MSSDLTSGPLSLRLRAATSAQHRALESSLNLLRPELTEAQYLRILQAFFGFIAPWEAEVRIALGPLAGAMAGRTHAVRLVRDIAALGGETGNATCAALPRLASPAEALGSMYVIEGSTLGGQLITRQLEAQFGFTPDRGAAYFSGYGADNGRMWATFRTLLDESLAADDQPAAIEAARETFDSLRRWLQNNGVAQ